MPTMIMSGTLMSELPPVIAPSAPVATMRALRMAICPTVICSLHSPPPRPGEASPAPRPGSSLRLTTVGVTGLFPVADGGRLSGSIHTDVLLASFGRNEQAGAGVTASLVRAWR